MNSKVWKKNAVLATVILFVCVAVYLNWSYGREETDVLAPSASPSAAASLGEQGGTLTLSTDGLDAADAAGAVETDETQSLETDAQAQSDDDYFASVRLSREQARDSSLAILRESGELETASQQARDEAVAAANLIAENALKEAEIEGLVMAKGFRECVAYISSDGVDVVVAAPEGGLVAEQVSQIKDIVVNKTAASVEDIRIVGAE